MIFSYVKNGENPFPVISESGDIWYRVSDIAPEMSVTNVIDILNYEKDHPGYFLKKVKEDSSPPVDISAMTSLLPFEPRSYRDYMLYESHYINAAKGLVKKYIPKLLPVVKIYEKLSGKTFPKLKPKKNLVPATHILSWKPFEFCHPWG